MCQRQAMLTPGLQVDPEADRITVDGKTIAEDKKIYVLLNKPKGVVSTLADRHAEQTVMVYCPLRNGCLLWDGWIRIRRGC